MSLALHAFLADCSALGLADSVHFLFVRALLGRAVLLVPRGPELAPRGFLGVGSLCWTLLVSLRLRAGLGGAGSG